MSDDTTTCRTCDLEASTDAFWLPANTNENIFCSKACMMDTWDFPPFTTEEGWDSYVRAISSDPDTIFEDEVDLELMAERILGECDEHGLERPCGLCGDDTGWMRARLIAACREIARLR